jgi:hypothetical protein
MTVRKETDQVRIGSALVTIVKINSHTVKFVIQAPDPVRIEVKRATGADVYARPEDFEPLPLALDSEEP